MELAIILMMLFGFIVGGLSAILLDKNECQGKIYVLRHDAGPYVSYYFFRTRQAPMALRRQFCEQFKNVSGKAVPVEVDPDRVEVYDFDEVQNAQEFSIVWRDRACVKTS